MLFEDLLYIIGLVLVSLYLLMGLDDFIWDIFGLSKRLNYRQQRLDMHKLDSNPPKLLAMAIAAWHEDNVLGDVIDNIIQSAHYPKSMYHIFLGVYPNDDATVAVARDLAARHQNVHVVINCQPGPTSKAQNLNYVITQIKLFERERRWRFASLTIHDSEDVVHPYELKATSYLLDTHAAIQFPVFPLIQKPTFRNFFKNITTCTYADEFAENHFTSMVSRRNSGAFVPSAGTGFALSRETLDIFGDEGVLPENNLTEDYRLSLTLFQKGIQMYFVLEHVPRVEDSGKIVWDFITTRSMFPNTFKTAVKQKTRWLLGITMQSFKFKDIFKIKGLRFIGRYSLYKDQKAKIGNLLPFIGYPILIYFFVSLFTLLTTIYPIFTLSWWLSLVVTVMMIERQIYRSVALYNVYGMRSVFFACLFPPIVPLRIVWGNIINLVATIKAYKQKIFGQSSPKNKKQKAPLKSKDKQLAWDKTDHTFLDKKVLQRYHRKLGDIQIEKGYVSPQQIRAALRDMPSTPQETSDYILRQIDAVIKKQKYISHRQLDYIFSRASNKQTLGGYFLEAGMITEEQLLNALSYVKHIQYVDETSIKDYDIARLVAYFDKELLYELLVIPLMETDQGFVIAFCDNSPNNAQTILREKYGYNINSVFASQGVIMRSLDVAYGSLLDAGRNDLSVVSCLYNEGIIGYEQAIIARNYKSTNDQTEVQVLKYMGLLTEEYMPECCFRV